MSPQPTHRDGDERNPSPPPILPPEETDLARAVTVGDLRYRSGLSSPYIQSPPTRLFRVWSLSNPSRLIERENINFRDGFVIFSNGPDHSVQTDVIALSAHTVTRIEEQLPVDPEPTDHDD